MLVILGMLPVGIAVLLYSIVYTLFSLRQRDRGDYVPVETPNGVVIVNMNDPQSVRLIATMQQEPQVDTHRVARDLSEFDDSIEDYETKTAGPADERWFDGPAR